MIDKHNGLYISLDLISNWYINLELKWYNPILYHDGPIMFKQTKMIKKKPSCFLKDYIINLLDLHLQKQIFKCMDLNANATEALTFLLEQDLTMLWNDLNDWTVKKVEGNNVLFYKGKTIYQEMHNFERTLHTCFMIMKQLVIHKN